MLSNLKAIAFLFCRKSGIVKFHKYGLKSKGYSLTLWQKISNFEVSQICCQI